MNRLVGIYFGFPPIPPAKQLWETRIRPRVMFISMNIFAMVGPQLEEAIKGIQCIMANSFGENLNRYRINLSNFHSDLVKNNSLVSSDSSAM